MDTNLKMRRGLKTWWLKKLQIGGRNERRLA
jgi:hypothetical protein